MSIEDPRLKSSIVVRRSPHRSTTFCLQFDISSLMTEHGEPLVEGQELEDILIAWCIRGVKDALAKGRAAVVSHP